MLLVHAEIEGRYAEGGCLMYRKIGIYYIGILLLLLCISIGDLGQAFQKTWVKEYSKPVLRVGLLSDCPPYDFYNDKNQLVGFNVDLIRAMGQRLGKEVEITTIPYNRVMMGMLFRRYDVIAAPQSMAKHRMERVNFTLPYLESGDVILYHPNQSPVNSLEDVKINKFKIAVFNGTSYPGLLKSKGMAENMIVYPSRREMFLAFLNGKADVLLMDMHIADYYQSQKSATFGVSDGLIRTDKMMAFSVRKEDVKLVKKLDAAIMEMQRDGTLGKLKNQWGIRELRGISNDTNRVREPYQVLSKPTGAYSG
jgi:polar amino acid transport system substrate-binding protein